MNPRRTAFAIVALAILLIVAARVYQRPLVLVNARIYQGGAISGATTALVVRGGEIVFLGADEKALARSPWDAKIIDLGERLVLPGFIDAHVHPMFGAMMDAACPLQEVETSDQLRDTLARCHADEPSEVLLGFGLNQSLVKLDQSLFGQDFDDQPVLLIAYDVHTAFLNRAGLEAMGITAATPNPDDGLIEKDPATGEPTGLLLDGALHNVLLAMGNPSALDSVTMLRDWVRHANQLGYTSLLDAGGGVEAAGFYQLLDRLGLLDIRLHSAYVLVPTEPGVAQLQALLDGQAFHPSDTNAAATIKLLIDGVIESNTGALEAGYGIEGDPPPPYFAPEKLKELVIAADAQGIMVHMHATGDRAVNLAIDAVAAAREANGNGGPTHTVAHAELIAPEAIQRLAPLNMVLNTTPIWIAPPDETYETYVRYVGEKRIHWLQPLRSILDSGASLSFGSDYPVTSNDPFLAIETAVTRKDAIGMSDRVFEPAQRITVAEAIDSLTRSGARQLMQDGRVGSLETGKAADLIVLGQNLFDVPAEAISETRVDLTVVHGRIVYQRD
ncbi:MAG: amidohydrolase [Deltaproteobacteria bacterium]|nr:amidohydrolase [Deltaproteobacteria bacterium]